MGDRGLLEEKKEGELILGLEYRKSGDGSQLWGQSLVCVGGGGGCEKKSLAVLALGVFVCYAVW